MRKAGGNFQQRRFSLPAGLKLSSACETLLQMVPTPRAMSVSIPSNVRMHRTLVVVSCMSEAEDFQRHLPLVRYPDAQFIYPHDISSDVMTHDRLLATCREIISGEEVDALVCIHPHLMFVHASLLAQYSHLKGPSFESIFLCSHRDLLPLRIHNRNSMEMHIIQSFGTDGVSSRQANWFLFVLLERRERYYCRKYITRGFHNNYSIVQMDDFTSLQVSEHLREFTLPVMFMEAMNCTSRPLTILLHTLKDLRKELDEIKTQVADNLKELNPLIAEKVDEIYYDLAQESLCLLEEVKPHLITSKLDHCDTGLYVVECCVSDGEVIPWVISDVNYWANRPHCKKSVTIPTTMGVSTQFEVWAVIREILEKLMSFGFKDSFVNITIQVNHDGSVRVHDIFPGFVYDNVPLNRFVYQNGDTLKAHCDIGAGQEPSHVKMRPKQAAMKGYITLFGSGVLSDLVHLKLLKSNKHVTLSVPDGVRLQISNSRPQSGFSSSDTNRTPRSRSSLSSLEYSHSRLTTPETSTSRLTTPDTSLAHNRTTRSRSSFSFEYSHSGLMTPETNRSRLTTPDTSLAPIAEMNQLTANDEQSVLEDTAAKCESDTSDDKPSETIVSSSDSPDDNETESTRYSNQPTPAEPFAPTQIEKSPVGEVVTGSNLEKENTPVPALLLEPDRDSRDEDKESDDPLPVIVADSDTGVCIGQIYVFGSTTEDCTRQLADFLRTVMKRKEHCPWLAHQ